MSAENSPLHEIVAFRRQKLEALKAAGVDPFGQRFANDGSVAKIRGAFVEGQPVRIAGRVTAHRDMGKSQFFDLSDVTGRMQVFLHAKEIGEEAWHIFKQIDLGDFVGVEGDYFVTKTGEPTIRARVVTVLSKSLHPLPDKWHGVSDTETKYRQRYLDLIANPESREVFLKRIRIVREIRRFLEDREFVEVETPMMQAVAGGAAAQPFKTHHNALGQDLYLRIAPELYLKRLLVGGFPKLFELNRNFRNEGISRRHNPEFTMLEAYWAYADFEAMADLVEELVCHLSETINGSLLIETKNSEGEVTKTVNLSRPWKRARYEDLIRGVVSDWFELDLAQKQARAGELGLDVSNCTEAFEITQQIFEKCVEEKTLDPLYVTHLPVQLVPLARQNRENSAEVDVYELIINGQEISPGYSELNDPDVQRQRLLDQSGGEQHNLDEEFLHALEYGMPPAGGIGIGIDRLVMMLAGAESIRDVVLFPHLKNKPA